MDVLLDPKLSVERNAEVYFERAKRLKRKVEGVKIALDRFEKELVSVVARDSEVLEKSSKLSLGFLEWFEKFRWFVSSDGFLCVGGRDAVSNELVVKKRAEKGDIVFHTSIPGSPFFVVKAGGKTVPDVTLQEVAIATASFSRAWRDGFASAEVYCIAPEQVLKTDPSGISLPRGSFYIAGRKMLYQPVLSLAVGKCGVIPGSIAPSRPVMCGPVPAVKKWCSDVFLVGQGSGKVSDSGKKLSKLFGVPVDDVVRVLPSGGVSVKKL